MRLAAILALTLAVLVGTGCKPPPRDTRISMFKDAVHRHFNRLNDEALQRKTDLLSDKEKVLKNPTLPNPTGTTFSLFEFKDEAYIVFDFPCRTCSTKLLITVPEKEYLCPHCRHCPYKIHPKGTKLNISPCATCVGPTDFATPPEASDISAEALSKYEGAIVKQMFELEPMGTEEGDEHKPLIATVRYIRRLWAFDEYGVVNIPAKAITDSGSDSGWIPSRDGTVEYPTALEPGAGTRAGFHRHDGTYVGQMTFTYAGGKLRQMDSGMLDSMKEDELVTAISYKKIKPRVASKVSEVPQRPWKDLKGGRR